MREDATQGDRFKIKRALGSVAGRRLTYDEFSPAEWRQVTSGAMLFADAREWVTIMFLEMRAVALVTAVVVTGCAIQEEQSSEEAAEEAGVEEEKAQKAEESSSTPFEGEHENLQSGDTAVWREGLELTISDVHLAPNESRRSAEESRKKQEARGKEPKGKSPAEDAPPELIGK